MTDLMGCLGCDGTYEVGLLRCPQCGTRSPMYQSTEGDGGMPTITSGGASNAWEELEPGARAAVESAPVAAAPVPADAEAVTVVVGEAGSELESPAKASTKKATAKKAAPAEAPPPAVEPEA